jgi:hypothetical protein
MLVYISIGIVLCNITVCLVFGLTWAYLGHEIRQSSLLQAEFSAGRRLIGSVSLFAIPVAVYFLDSTKQSENTAEHFAFAWGALLRGEFIDVSRGFNNSGTRC